MFSWCEWGSRYIADAFDYHANPVQYGSCADSENVTALANEDTLLPTQMFPRLPDCATFVVDTNFVSGTQKMFLILFRNILCPQQLFPSLRNPRNIMGNNVSATMCPRLPGS